MVALVGDAELDEGNIFEALLEGWKQGLRNCWWIIDYNRQSLDAVVREGLYERIIALFEAMGWEVKVLKYGSLLEAAFAERSVLATRDIRVTAFGNRVQEAGAGVVSLGGLYADPIGALRRSHNRRPEVSA